MIQHFEHLSEDQRRMMYESVPRVALLIAGADGSIDLKEIQWAEKLTEIRSYAFDEVMQPFYAAVHRQFKEVFHNMIEEYPDDTEARTEKLREELSQLNQLIGNIDPVFARHYYHSLVSFARHVAEASGGFLRFGTISKEEQDLIELPMIQKPA